MMKRADLNDGGAIGILGEEYMNGAKVPTDKAKGLELLSRAADLGDEHGCNALGWRYLNGKGGVSRDKAKAKQYYGRAAEKGDVIARARLGYIENNDLNYRAAMRHWRIAAAGGSELSVTNLIRCYETEQLRHNDLAWCLQAKDKACIEMKSEQRTEYEKYFEEFGAGDGENESEYWWRRVNAALVKKT